MAAKREEILHNQGNFPKTREKRAFGTLFFARDKSARNFAPKTQKKLEVPFLHLSPLYFFFAGMTLSLSFSQVFNLSRRDIFVLPGTGRRGRMGVL